MNDPISRRAVHVQVASRPDTGGADVGGEDRVVGGEPVDRGGDVLRMQRRVVPAVPGELVQPFAGPPVMRGHPVQVRRIGLGRDQRQQRIDRVLDGADQRNVDRHPAADLLAPHVDLDHRYPARIKLPVGEVGAEHDQRVAVLHRPVTRAESDQPGHPHIVGIVILDELLAAERVQHGCPQRFREADELVMRPGAPSAGQDGHPPGRIQHLSRGGKRGLRRPGHRRRCPHRSGLRAGRSVGQEHVPRDDDGGDPAALQRRPHRDFQDARELLGDADQLAVDAALAKQLLRMGLLEVIPADLHSRNVRSDRQDGHPAAVGVEQAVDQVQVARPAASSAYRQFPGQRRLPGSRERGRLLMTHMVPGDPPGPAQRVGESVQ